MAMTGAFGNEWGTDLDLTENEVSEGLPVLKAGIYDVKSVDLENKASKSGKMLVVTFNEVNGKGQIRMNFNYANASAEAQRIGRDQLKTFLTHGKHPDPDHPFQHPKEAMLGLGVRIVVEFDGTYTKNNKTYDSFAIRRFTAIDPAVPATGADPSYARAAGSSGSVGRSSTSSSANTLNDEIPF